MADGDKYIPNGVWLRCDKGTLPRKLSILPKTVKLYGQDWAGHLDAVPMVNIPTFGVCAIIKACMPATMMWQGAQNDVSIMGQSPILDTSTCQCGVGGTIKIYFTKQAADDAGSEQEAKQDAEFWGNVATGLLVVGAIVGTAAIIVASGGTALVVLGAAAATGAAVGGVAGAVQGGITGGAEGAASGFLMGAGLGALGGIAAVGAPLIAGAAAVAGVVSLGYLGKAFYHNPSEENGLVLVGAIAGLIAGGLTGRGLSRLSRPVARTPQEETGFFGGKGRQPNPNFGDTVGEYSGRDYYRGKCGGPIKNLSWKEAKISKEGIATVKRHTSRFEKTEANTKMIERLEKIERGEIEPTDYDKRYYTHEIREYERFGEMGIPDNQRGTYEDWNNAHSATLEDFKVNEREQPIYHPDADID